MVRKTVQQLHLCVKSTYISNYNTMKANGMQIIKKKRKFRVRLFFGFFTILSLNFLQNFFRGPCIFLFFLFNIFSLLKGVFNFLFFLFYLFFLFFVFFKKSLPPKQKKQKKQEHISIKKPKNGT